MINLSGVPKGEVATQADAEAGIDTTKVMTAQRTAQAIAALVGSPTKKFTSTLGGDITVQTGVARWYPSGSITVDKLEAFVSTAPVGANLTFDLLKNGSVVASGSVVDGTFKMVSQTISVIMTENDYFTIDITQVGSTTAGATLVVRGIFTEQ